MAHRNKNKTKSRVRKIRGGMGSVRLLSIFTKGKDKIL